MDFSVYFIKMYEPPSQEINMRVIDSEGQVKQNFDIELSMELFQELQNFLREFNGKIKEFSAEKS